MKKIIALLCVCFCAVNVSVKAEEAMLSQAEKAYILSRFSTEVKYNFAFLDRLKFNFDSLCRASMSRLVATESDEEFLLGMQRLCATLQDGHTSVFALNNPQNPADWIRPLPMQTKRIADRVFVTQVYSSALQNAGIVPGCEVLSIDGENVIEYAARNIEPYLASSTPQWTKFRPFAEFELTKDKGSKVSKFVFRDRKGKEFTLETNRNMSWDLRNDVKPMELQILKGNIGLLTVRSFQDSEFDRACFDELYNEILKTDALIIDIRGNGGGNSSHADYMICHFSESPIPQGSWRSPMYIAAHGSWRFPQEWYMQTPHRLSPAGGKEIYKKPVVLLVNETTFSSAENFCVSFRGAQRGKIIGTPTGGSTGNPIMINLGGGIGCQICTKAELDAQGNEFIGVGIRPDIIVEEDIALFLKNRDNIVEKAIEILRAK